MSFILDALKKSETERQRQGSAEFATIPSSRAGSSPPRWLWVLVLLLLVNLVVLAGILLRDQPAATTPASSPPAVAPAITPATTPADTGEPPAAGTASFEARIADARSRQPPPGIVEETAPVPEPSPKPAAPEPATPEPADETVEQRPPAGQPDEPGSETLSLPTLAQLRAGGILSLPDLHLDIHVYSETPADRFVFVNMSKHRENSRLASGPVVERITPEGVVLDYQGTRFLLPRE